MERTYKQHNVAIKVLGFAEHFQVLEPAPKKHQVQDQRRDATLHADLEVGHVHFVPDPGIGHKITHAQAQNRIVLNAIECSQHQVFAVLVRSVGGLLGGIIAGKR